MAKVEQPFDFARYTANIADPGLRPAIEGWRKATGLDYSVLTVAWSQWFQENAGFAVDEKLCQALATGAMLQAFIDQFKTVSGVGYNG
jgi:hypothetical protein